MKVYSSSFVSLHHVTVPPPSHLRQPNLFKIICHVGEKTKRGRFHEKVVGVHGIGRGMDEIIQLVGVVVRMGISK